MSRSPFLNDPLDDMSKHINAAVLSPLEDVRAIHLRVTEHLTQLAKNSGVIRQKAFYPAICSNKRIIKIPRKV